MRRRTLLRTVGATALGAGLSGCTDFTTPGGDESDADGATDAYEPLGSVALDGAAEAVVGDDGDTAYVAGVDGFATVDVSDPSNPTVRAELTDLLTDAGETFLEILDVTVDGDRLAAAGPANPRDGVFHGFVLYDVSDPADPVPATDPYETDYHIHNCFLADELLYVVANDEETDPNALVIYDVGGDEVAEVGRWSPLDHDPGWEDVHWLLRYLHDVSVRDDLAVLACWNAGTYLLDVSDPTEPVVRSRIVETDLAEQRERSGAGIRAAQMGLPGNDHYAAVDETGDLLAIGREAWRSDQAGADRPGGIDLYDVRDLEDPAPLATIEAPKSVDETYTGVWTTSHNFELRDGILCSSWYQGGVKLHDVSDPAEPEQIAWWRDPFETAFWTARVAEPGESFVASSTAYTPSNHPENALYTFPIAEGEQADPPSLDDPGLLEE